MSAIRRALGKIPKPLHASARRLGRAVLTEVFAIPDPFRDLERIVRHVNPVAILDIGAHIGETSLELAKRFPDIPIHAFEPTPSSFKLLQFNTRHLTQVQAHQVALGRKQGTQQLYINNNAQTNSLLDNASGNIAFLGNDTKHHGCVDVQVTTLDKWVSENLAAGDLIVKADVQGGELHLLQGGVETVTERIAALYTEVSVAELYMDQADLLSLLSLMQSTGLFVLYQLYRTRSNEHGRALWLDAMWVRSEIAAALEAN